MSDFLDFPTLIAIGVAIFVLIRLRSVLGTRNGNERPPQERYDRIKSQDEKQDSNVVPMRPTAAEENDGPIEDTDADRWARKLGAEIEQLSNGDEAIAKGLGDLARADENFSPKTFVEGAKSAYEMIVTAFAQGDRKTLKNLLDKEVYEGFEGVITDRESQNHTVDFTFVGLPGTKISDVEVDKRSAQVTVRFDAEIVSATKDADGALIEGNEEEVASISDEWTFSRSLKSRDPNWKLVATNQID